MQQPSRRTLCSSAVVPFISILCVEKMEIISAAAARTHAAAATLWLASQLCLVYTVHWTCTQHCRSCIVVQAAQ